MAATVSVRLAQPGEAEKVGELVARLKTLNEELDPHYKVVNNLLEVSVEYAREAIESDRARVIVAVDESTGELVGVLVYWLENRRFYEPRVKAKITEFYVLPRYRRKRVGSLLLEKALELAARDGAGMVTVIYPAGNVLADEFYKAKGFIDLAYEKYKSLR